ncbi:MAG: hypothetical protein WA966_10570 [Ornithinimicrobium sp.]
MDEAATRLRHARLLRVAQLRAAELQVDRLLALAVREARQAPAATWDHIGEYIGTSGKNAFARWHVMVRRPIDKITGTGNRAGSGNVGGPDAGNLPGVAEGIVCAVLDALAVRYDSAALLDADATAVHLHGRNLTIVCDGVEVQISRQSRR